MEQSSLFALEITDKAPANTITAHLKMFVIADDGQEYAAKGIHDGYNERVSVPHPNQIPAAEWLCSNLAEICGLPIPNYKILLDKNNGNYYFGSRIELACDKAILDGVSWLNRIKNASEQLKKQLWSIHAFDLFIYNMDRHINNYLYVVNRSNSFDIQAFDFSLSSLVLGWPKEIDLSAFPNCNTSNSWSYIKKITGIKDEYTTSALKILGKLKLIDVSKIDDIFSKMPSQWVNEELKINLIDWWQSPARLSKIDLVIEEIKNESI
ncbi:hypothetical protein A9G40_08105 [Gilliamella sp. Nev3-1]|nr:hypothetical protein A9G40_08105 [Gilliamella apicola]